MWFIVCDHYFISLRLTVLDTGTAKNITDFNVPSVNDIVFGPGEKVKSLLVGIVDDSMGENVETFPVQLSSTTSNVNITGKTTLNVIIKDDDSKYLQIQHDC